MGFPLTDLIIESVLRDGLENIRRMPEIIDDLFSQLVNLPPSIANKYGQAEINKIKEMVLNREVSVIMAFPVNNTPMPCISLQLLSSKEEVPLTMLDDYQDQIQTPMSAEELQNQIVASNLQILAYDPNSGIVEIGDTADLAKVHANQIFADSDGNEYPILGGINDTPGSRQVIVQKQATLNIIGPALIKSSIDYNQYVLRTNVENESILMGIHTKDALTTKYLFTIVKYILESRKKDLITRGYMSATYEGSDFNRNDNYDSNVIYSRFLTVSGKIYNTWNSDQVIPIDSIEVIVKVEKDKADNEDLGLENSTIQVEED